MAIRLARPQGRPPGRAPVLVAAVLLVAALLYKYSTIVSPVGSLTAQPQSLQSSLLTSLRLASSLDQTGGSSEAAAAAGGGGSTEDDDGAVDEADSGPSGATKGPRVSARALPRIDYGLIAEPDPKVVKKRCLATRGDWCGRYDAQLPIPAKAPPRGNHTCLWGCNFVGVCDAMKGWCNCPAGWTGDHCSTRMKRPCSQTYHPHGFEPYDKPFEMGPGGTTLACADLCDEDIAHCYCNSTFAHGRIPADPSSPPGTPPVRAGRPIAHYCRRGKDDAGNKIDFGTVEPELLYGKDGWCVADTPKWTCPCILDGLGGPTCETPHEAFCPNQCNGHGECIVGFCKCHEGWFGHDCAYRTADTEWSPGMEDGERPWLKPHVHTPAARDPEPGATRKRPLIYVYELPAFYNEVMLQYRVQKSDCVHRLFGDSNNTAFNDHHLYNPEPGLHEMLLQSEHRTLDPEEADYFYLPIYASCLLFPILGSNDFPWFHGGPVALRTHSAMNMMIEVHHWVRSHYPYWDRNGGRDHIVMAVHDEGSCWVPAVLRPAIILSHWGRKDLDHVSGTGYEPDNYTIDTHHPVWQPEGHVSKLGHFPCYDPSKDMVVPPMFSPSKYQDSPVLGAPTKERRILGFFKGRTQQNNPPYSRGIRQFLENYSRDNDWWGKHKIYLGEGNPPGETAMYSTLLSSSIFCFAIMGDGWSSRFEDGLMHGCIPVIIQDGVDVAFTSILEVESYSIRIEQKDMERIPEILQAVSQEDIARMQANIAKVWRRYMWTGLRAYADDAKRLLERYQPEHASEAKSQPVLEAVYDPSEDDAFSTIIQWLYSRLDDLGAHAAPSAASDK